MQYLVLRQFISFGKMLKKGTVVDEKQIRSPRLRRSEGKIIPAVSSFNVPVECGSEGHTLQDVKKDEDKIVAPKLKLRI